MAANSESPRISYMSNTSHHVSDCCPCATALSATQNSLDHYVYRTSPTEMTKGAYSRYLRASPFSPLHYNSEKGAHQRLIQIRHSVHIHSHGMYITYRDPLRFLSAIYLLSRSHHPPRPYLTLRDCNRLPQHRYDLPRCVRPSRQCYAAHAHICFTDSSTSPHPGTYL
ncbi:hypothetical protein MVEN_01636100 [Mycena venus]|uniref:Uncharacterized protein n=1 Tax=Mycena venus TaxID=2733690 RepID=A0A8H7CNY3_9AGAR|nr:hypothetical protein MVEN_01636100 [Mycena venus]